MRESVSEIRILHVDDEPDFADMTATFLERETDRFTVETVTAPGEALEGLAIGEFDCIVSDYDMPHISGIEFLETVREDHPELPFILFTGKGSEDVASNALAADATDYLQKGSGTDRYKLLANRIQNAVDQYQNKQRRAQLERIRALVNDINQQIVRASSRQEIITEVCSILAGADPYTLAVFAEVAPDTKEIVPHTWRGTGEGFLDEFEMSVSEDAPGRHAPGGQAFHEREIAVAQNIQSDPEYEHWRELALDHGFRALAVVPLEYESELYGLLAIFADRPHAFDEMEQEVLAEVGDDIAHGVHAQEIRADLRESNLRLERYQEYTEDVIDAIDDLFFVHDENGELQRWNDAFVEVTGYSDAEIASMNGIEFTPEEHRERTAAAIERVFETGHARLETPLLTKHGETIPYEYTADRVDHPDGEPRLVGVGRDISERKQRERELRESERRYRTLAENFPNGGVFLLDEDLRFQLVCGAGFDPIETSPEDLTGNTVDEVDPFSDEVADLLETTYRRALEGEKTTAELTYEGHIYDLRAVPVRDQEGAVTQVLAITQDITERKEQERELKRQNDRLQEFARIVSHDLRNPLNVVEGRLELACEDCDSEHLEHATTALDRSLSLIEDLLTLAREGVHVGEFESVDLGNVMEHCWRTAPTAEATLVTDTDRMIRADRSRLEQVLENLIRNAVEHGGDDVTVTIGDFEEGFYVADDGPGIPEDDHAQVFEFGYSTADGGTGYGLSIVKEIVDAHGWKIRVVESESGGTRFEFIGVDAPGADQ